MEIKSQQRQGNYIKIVEKAYRKGLLPTSGFTEMDVVHEDWCPTLQPFGRNQDCRCDVELWLHGKKLKV